MPSDLYSTPENQCYFSKFSAVFFGNFVIILKCGLTENYCRFKLKLFLDKIIVTY